MPVQFGALIPVQQMTTKHYPKSPGWYEVTHGENLYRAASETAQFINQGKSRGEVERTQHFNETLQQLDPNFKTGDKVLALGQFGDYEVKSYLVTGQEYDQAAAPLKEALRECLEKDQITTPVDQFFNWLQNHYGFDYSLSAPWTNLSKESIQKLIQVKNEVLKKLLSTTEKANPLEIVVFSPGSPMPIEMNILEKPKPAQYDFLNRFDFMNHWW